MDQSTPRINSSMIQSNKGNIVRLVGMVKSLEGTVLLLESCDQGQVSVHLPSNSNIESPFVEVVGKVNQDGSIGASIIYSLGEVFDLATYNRFLNYIPKDSSLF